MLEIIVVTYLLGCLANLLLIGFTYQKWLEFIESKVMCRIEAQVMEKAFGTEKFLQITVAGQSMLSWYFIFILLYNYLRFGKFY